MARKLATDSSALPPESIWIDTCWASTLWMTVCYELQGDQKTPLYEAMVCWEDGTHIYRFPGDLDSAAAAAKSLQSCLTLCDPIDGSPPGSPVPGILQARTLEWVAISFSNAWKWKVKVKSLSHVRLVATPWTAAYQAPLSMGFSMQEYWNGVPLPSAELDSSLN